MTREEAIKIISQMIKDEEGFLSDNTVEAHKMAIKALEQECVGSTQTRVEKTLDMRWVPVSERLPENHNQEVLISFAWGIDIGRYSDGEWHSEWINHYDDGDVLAWMPLPEPYKARK